MNRTKVQALIVVSIAVLVVVLAVVFNDQSSETASVTVVPAPITSGDQSSRTLTSITSLTTTTSSSAANNSSLTTAVTPTTAGRTSQPTTTARSTQPTTTKTPVTQAPTTPPPSGLFPVDSPVTIPGTTLVDAYEFPAGVEGDAYKVWMFEWVSTPTAVEACLLIEQAFKDAGVYMWVTEPCMNVTDATSLDGTLPGRFPISSWAETGYHLVYVKVLAV